jgi:phosphoenolpyruvate-protein phosphotransferase (PTS system enzyme I)
MKPRDREISDRRGPCLGSGQRMSESAPPMETTAGTFHCGPGTRPPISMVSTATPPTIPMQVLRGLAVSPGIAIGPVVVLDPHGPRLPRRSIASDSIAGELERLDRGFESAQIEAGVAEAEARSRLGPQYADILAAHGRMITDPSLRRDARKLIEQDLVSAEHAVLDVLEGYAARLERLTDSHLAARAADVRDIESRILSHLVGHLPRSFQDELLAPTIVLAHDLTPSEAARLDPRRIQGFATEAGGRASHTAIVAAALEIPAVVGLGKFLDRALHCQMAIIDGDEGLLILNPDLETQQRYRQAGNERSARFRVLMQQADLPAQTLDGEPVELWGNIEFGGEVTACLDRGAVGVGLFRTEFLFLSAESAPTEDEQYHAYAAVVRSMLGRPITIRTLDLGADKVTTYRKAGYQEPNPALGLRSLRLSLRDPELFRPQLRALLRASALGEVRIMFPLVSTLAEVIDARTILNDVAAELTAEGYAIGDKVPVGIMVEVPAAALIADHLAKEVDFFSIGTNDLIQYTLAVDRTNETVADLYCAADPAVLRLIAMVVEAARKERIAVSVCGTMGGEPVYAMLLLGLGLRQLSMPPHQLPEIKRVIRGIRMETARDVAAKALRLTKARDVVELLESMLSEVLPEKRDEFLEPVGLLKPS